ncbi:MULTISPECIES: TerD family protein [Clostridium]|uniref:Tellurium resistance protein terE, putative n=1 Tax=Clostridium novyi (strain NT) TaxID=386415 RepID=A0Q3C9_CLONN|nr:MULTISPECIES: TerD family protein [Clostridium]ABK62581.1 tellurium resistance protein terE, putative [Clostridium novyi NT]KEH86754.1 stress protein [Clostridium novyi A str. 4540]KEH87587.1 stress protein [Clostridium novyi A str. NCTC 538]KEH87657.1 stress protein [Clostridium novyi A str. BKT29909]KEH92608.1 stress protein [Clostridium botulinum C/D str. It1]
MAINLQKGQRISLTKEDSKLSRIMVGLGWDPVEQSRGGILGLLFGSSAPAIDCDASVIMLNENSKAEEIVYFGNLKDRSSSVMHMGDNLTGEGDGDDEQILVELSKVPANISRLVFVVNIYNCVKRNQHFGMIRNAFIRILDLQNNKELLRFNLSDDYSNKTGIYAGEIYRHGNEWKFAAIGEGDNVTGLKDMLDKYR